MLILHFPDNNGRSHLYLNTSKSATGRAICQIQNGKPSLKVYISNKLLEATQNYPITVFKLCGLTINIASFPHL